MSDTTNFIDAQEDGQANFNFKEFIQKYLKFLPLVLLCASIGAVISYFILRYSVPTYKVQSSMMIQDNSGSLSSMDSKFSSIFMGASGGAQNLYNEMEILKSRPLLKRVASNLQLQKTYYTQGNVKSSLLYLNLPVRMEIAENPFPEKGFNLLITVIDNQKFSITESGNEINFGESFIYQKRKLKLIRVSEIHNKADEPIQILINYQPLSSAAEGIKGNLTVGPVGDNTSILGLSIISENTDVGKDILNNIMSVYDSLNIEAKTKTAQITLQFVDDRLDTVRKELSEIERNLQVFMEKSNLYDLDAQAANYLSIYNDYYKQQSQLAIQQSVLDWLEGYLKDRNNNYKIVPISLGIQEPVFIGLVTQYNQTQVLRESTLKTTPESNPVINTMDVTLEKLRVNMLEALNNIKQSYKLTNNNLNSTSQGALSEIQSLPAKSRQMLEIKRRQQIMQDLYSFLLQKKIEVSISSASTISIARVIEPAIASTVPVKPNRKSAYLIGILMGLAIPIGIIFIVELLNDKIRSRTEVERITHAPIIGEVGHSENEDLPLVVKGNSRKFIAEQFRIIRTNLQFILNKVEKPVILVTSTFSGEGKSFISTNLGGVMALAGKKTLIMEFDIRKPKIAAGLGISGRKGMTNFLVGNVPLEDLIVPVEDFPNLFVLPCGPVPPNPAELLLAPGIREMFEYATKHFDTVIVDTAPVGVVSDALVLGEFANGTLYIIRQGYTYKKQVEFIEDMYRQKKLPRQAIIINDIKHVRGYGGYYGYGYGYATGKKNHYFDEQKKTFFKMFSRGTKQRRKL